MNEQNIIRILEVRIDELEKRIKALKDNPKLFEIEVRQMLSIFEKTLRTNRYMLKILDPKNKAVGKLNKRTDLFIH